MKFVGIAACFVVLLSSTYGDDGSFAADSGGPVAQKSRSEATGGSDFGILGDILAKMDPCESQATSPLKPISPLRLKRALGDLVPDTSSITNNLPDTSSLTNHLPDTSSLTNNSVVNAVSSAGSAVSNAAGNAAGTVTNATGNVASGAASAAGTAAGTLVNGTSAVAGAVVSGTTNALYATYGYAKTAFDYFWTNASLFDNVDLYKASQSFLHGDWLPGKDFITAKFEEFKKKYNKSYTVTEAVTAVENFIINFYKKQLMQFLRSSVFDASFGITKFSDLSLSVFLSELTGADIKDAGSSVSIDSQLLPEKLTCKKVYWPKYGVVSKVRLQDKCGSCYAMSGADLIASQYHIDNYYYNQMSDLSAQYLVDCMPQPHAYGCSGGRSANMLNYLAKNKDHKIPTESCYPYKDHNSTCKSKNPECKYKYPVDIKWAQAFDLSGPNEQEMMAALLQHGPVVAIVGVNEAWQMYNGTGVIKSVQCTFKQMHAVLVVGYDYTQCVPKYYVKNSWGEDWGQKGYILLEAGKNTCSVAKTVIPICMDRDCPKDKAEYAKYLMNRKNYPDCRE